MNEPSDEPLPIGEPGPPEDSFPKEAAEPSNGNGNGNGHSRLPAQWKQQLMESHHSQAGDFMWPGWEGVPFRGSNVPFLKDTDSPQRQPQIAYEPHVWILDLSIKEDLEDYRSVFQLVTNGAAVISAEERQYDPEKKNWKVFLRWALVFAHMPKEFAPRA